MEDGDGESVTDAERWEFAGYIEYVRARGTSIFSPRAMKDWNDLEPMIQQQWISEAATHYASSATPG